MSTNTKGSDTLDELIDGFSDYIYWKLGGTYVTTAERLNRSEFKVAINEYIHAEVEKARTESLEIVAEVLDKRSAEYKQIRAALTQPAQKEPETWEYKCEVDGKPFTAKPYLVLEICPAHRAEFNKWAAQKDVPPTIQEPKHVSEKASGDTPAQKEENRG